MLTSSFTIHRKFNWNLLVGCLIFCITFLIVGCSKFVEVSPPDTSITSSVVYTNNASAAAVLTGIYDQMMVSSMSSGNQSISYLCGLSADELTNYYNNAPYSLFYENSLNASSFTQFWSELYNQIYVANSALQGLSSSTALSAGLKQQLMGEAYFMRGFLYFYATNLFGNVPLATTTDYQTNNSLSQSTKSLIYQQIISDLIHAQDDLSNNYLDPTNAVTGSRTRPNKWAAKALLARVYLYTGAWDSAAVQASAVINSGTYSLLTNPDSTFLANSQEAIWQLEPVQPGYNTFDAYFFVLTSAPGTGNSYVSLSPSLLAAFEPGDLRFTDWVGTFTSGTSTYYYADKYKVSTYNVGNPVTEYLMILRLAEQYLVRAEAKAELGDLTGAAADLNVVRNRAKLQNTTASSQADLLTAIWHERQVEFFTEWGHRWLDLIRTQNVDNVMTTVTPTKGGSWNANDTLYPIPQTEITANQKLVQNPGY